MVVGVGENWEIIARSGGGKMRNNFVFGERIPLRIRENLRDVIESCPIGIRTRHGEYPEIRVEVGRENNFMFKLSLVPGENWDVEVWDVGSWCKYFGEFNSVGVVGYDHVYNEGTESESKKCYWFFISRG